MKYRICGPWNYDIPPQDYRFRLTMRYEVVCVRGTNPNESDFILAYIKHEIAKNHYVWEIHSKNGSNSGDCSTLEDAQRATDELLISNYNCKLVSQKFGVML